jgi:peroxiredoxin
MTIKVGDRIPEGTFMRMTEKGPQPITAKDIFDGKKVVLFAVPGAFTPTCSNQHLPGFVRQADAIRAKGVNTIACLSVNDAFVMGAWAKAQNVGDKVLMLADGNGDFTKKLGLELDAKGFGMGVRAKRFALIADQGVVKHLAVETNPGQAVESGADAILSRL